MKKTHLSQRAKDVIDSYLNLKIGKEKVVTPYFNNRRLALRGALKVLIGKGSPEDINQEARILALKNKIDLDELDEEQIKKFLVDQGLGVDCSGFAFYVLDAELEGDKDKSLKQILKFSNIKNPIRKTLAKFRTVENTGVKVLSNKANSHEVDLIDVRAGDFISIIGYGREQDRDHIIIVEEVDENKINYIHSLAWSTDGKYEHGIRRGEIEITKPDSPITEQKWLESGKGDKENETLQTTLSAKEVTLRRLNAYR